MLIAAFSVFGREAEQRTLYITSGNSLYWAQMGKPIGTA